MASIGIQIKEARRKEGLTQTELAEKLNCSVNMILSPFEHQLLSVRAT